VYATSQFVHAVRAWRARAYAGTCVSACLCVCVCVNMHAYGCGVCACVFVCVRVCMYMFYVCMCACVYVCVCMNEDISNMSVDVKRVDEGWRVYPISD